MKNILIFSFLFILSSLEVFSQVPQGFNYQSILRDGEGNIIPSEDVIVNIAILQGSETGTIAFSEEHSVTTTAQGIINLHIGSVNSAQFTEINWAEGPYFVEITINGMLMGVSQLLSVPYALHANTVEIDQVEDDDADPTNELQDLSLNGTMLEISNGTGVDLEPIADKTVTITGTDGIYVDGTYPDFTVSSNEHYVGEFYGGGIVLYVDETKQHGLILSVADLEETGVTWDNGEFIHTGATSFWDGKSNTDSIIAAQGEGVYAAKLCADYSITTDQTYDDWYLPSARELFFLEFNDFTLHNILENDGNPDTEGFYFLTNFNQEGNYYWSSTHYINGSSYYAISLYIPGSDYNNVDTNSNNQVRAVRQF